MTDTGSRPRELVLYGRYGCHLCEEMRVALDQQREHWDFTIREVDISGDAELEQKFGTRVPVLTGNDTEICFYFLDVEAFRKYFEDSP
ncbi:MAG: glutaredoxin family protein [Gammaproteobacteria bacterium]|nr:glutaredoxin family protein [Gammaproteobacteria bacterium]MDH5593935.1 glutaredoxin family protein [Gammaproteobacteria bacterium]MDH5614579.1 glutaredoxin family protein [Gammaproteobacteria bacterium]